MVMVTVRVRVRFRIRVVFSVRVRLVRHNETVSNAQQPHAHLFTHARTLTPLLTPHSRNHAHHR